jgi:hypothetical protein
MLSEGQSQGGLVDGFFWYVAAFVLLLTLVDWYIGKSGKTKIRD